MIFISFNQLNIFLIFLFFGFVFSLIYNLINTILLFKFLKKINKIIINSIFFILFSCVFVFFLNIFNFGIINITLSLAYIFGFVLGVKVLNKTVVFLQNKWYTILNKKESHAKQFEKN